MVLIVLAATAAALSATPERRYSAEFEACSRKTGGVTVAIRDCIGDEYQRLDTDLNRRYRLLMRTLPKARANALRISERKCDVAGKENDGGTLELIMIDSCYLDSLYDRVAVLEAMQR
jgi:uncharacterized protein YecT (DUF1311 family)